MEEKYQGALVDTRKDEEIALDWQHDELASTGVIVEWKEKPESERKFFSKRNQAYSSSCMAQSGVKMLGIDNVAEEGLFFDLSALPVYDARWNKPSGGMALPDLLTNLCKPKACLESQLKSQNMSEHEMNQSFTFTEEMKKTAEKYRSKGFVYVQHDNIDKIAEVIAQGKGVELIMFFLSDEYWKEKPEATDPDLKYWETRASRHGICAVDYFIENGEKCLLIEDSAGNSSSIDGKGQRIITETFLKKRCYGAGYVINKKNNEGDMEKPVHTFFKTLKYGMKNDPEVKELQKVLQYEKFMPVEVNGVPFPPTGNFLGMTLGATKKLQAKYNLVADGIVGPKTNAKLNELYS